MYPAAKKDEVASFCPSPLFVFDAPLYPTITFFPCARKILFYPLAFK